MVCFLLSKLLSELNVKLEEPPYFFRNKRQENGGKFFFKDARVHPGYPVQFFS